MIRVREFPVFDFEDLPDLWKRQKTPNWEGQEMGEKIESFGHAILDSKAETQGELR